MKFAALILALCLGIVSAQSTQATYTIGGANVIFGFARVDNVTTMFWPRFSATASSATGPGGRLNSGTTDLLPSGYALASSFIYGTESIVRCLNLASGLAYVHLSPNPPTVIVSPLNGNDTDWASGVSVVIESGSLTYVN
jgi:hypothetical protein